MNGEGGELRSTPQVGNALWTGPARPPLAPLAAGLAAVGLIVAVWIWGFALPSAPEEVWVPLDVSLDIKPWASAHHAAGGTPVGLPGWFEEADGGPAPDWDETLLVRLEAKSPFLRKVVLSIAAEGNATWSTVARYRFHGDRTEIDGRSWGRYVCE